MENIFCCCLWWQSISHNLTHSQANPFTLPIFRFYLYLENRLNSEFYKTLTLMIVIRSSGNDLKSRKRGIFILFFFGIEDNNGYTRNVKWKCSKPKSHRWRWIGLIWFDFPAKSFTHLIYIERNLQMKTLQLFVESCWETNGNRRLKETSWCLSTMAP